MKKLEGLLLQETVLLLFENNIYENQTNISQLHVVFQQKCCVNSLKKDLKNSTQERDNTKAITVIWNYALTTLYNMNKNSSFSQFLTTKFLSFKQRAKETSQFIYYLVTAVTQPYALREGGGWIGTRRRKSNMAYA